VIYKAKNSVLQRFLATHSGQNNRTGGSIPEFRVRD
jgi:hypothetical protein